MVFAVLNFTSWIGSVVQPTIILQQVITFIKLAGISCVHLNSPVVLIATQMKNHLTSKLEQLSTIGNLHIPVS